MRKKKNRPKAKPNSTVMRKLRLTIAFFGSLRFFEREVQAPLLVIDEAIEAGVQAFNAAFNEKIAEGRERHAAEYLSATGDAPRAA